jgi:hypothetical protein
MGRRCADCGFLGIRNRRNGTLDEVPEGMREDFADVIEESGMRGPSSFPDDRIGSRHWILTPTRL